jgi:hypothetical protein
MPTRNRTRFLPRAIDCFLKQDYPHKQLLIVEEETRSLDSKDLPDNIVYLWSPDTIYASIGAKRNAMCAAAAGELIAHWDDDDWHAPHRISTQVEAMCSQSARLCGTDRLVFYNGERAYLFQTVRRPWLAGGTLVYDRSLWRDHPFTEVSNGEDTSFVDAAYKSGAKVAVISDPSLYVGMIHGKNTTPYNIDRQWSGFSVDQVRNWIGEKACSV